MADMAVEQATPGDDKAESKQFLTFQLAGEVYGVDILDIREIIDYGNLTSVPMMPEFIAGVINLRGAVVPVVSLASRFGQTPTEINKRTSIVIIEVREGDTTSEMGIIVDTVNEVMDIQPEDIAAPPAFGTKVRADFIRGMAKVNGRLLILLEVDHVLSIDELSLIEQVQANMVEAARPPELRNSKAATGRSAA